MKLIQAFSLAALLLCLTLSHAHKLRATSLVETALSVSGPKCGVKGELYDEDKTWNYKVRSNIYQ